MNLTELIQKIQGLSAEDREILRLELGGPPPKPETQEATPETIAAVNTERVSSHDERCLPLEDVIKDPKEAP